MDTCTHKHVSDAHGLKAWKDKPVPDTVKVFHLLSERLITCLDVMTWNMLEIPRGAAKRSLTSSLTRVTQETRSRNVMYKCCDNSQHISESLAHMNNNVWRKWTSFSLCSFTSSFHFVQEMIVYGNSACTIFKHKTLCFIQIQHAVNLTRAVLSPLT